MNQLNWNEIAKKHGYDDPVKMVVELYYLEDKSLEEAAARLIVSKSALADFMQNHGLPRREPSKALARRWSRGGPSCPACGCTKSRIIQSFPGEPYRRYRRCKECKRYFLTKEIPEQEDILGLEVLTKRAEDE